MKGTEIRVHVSTRDTATGSTALGLVGTDIYIYSKLFFSGSVSCHIEYLRSMVKYCSKGAVPITGFSITSVCDRVCNCTWQNPNADCALVQTASTYTTIRRVLGPLARSNDAACNEPMMEVYNETICYKHVDQRGQSRCDCVARQYTLHGSPPLACH